MRPAPTSRHVPLGLDAGLELAAALVRCQCCRDTEARSQITS
jgi:hypothetical protein